MGKKKDYDEMDESEVFKQKKPRGFKKTQENCRHNDRNNVCSSHYRGAGVHLRLCIRQDVSRRRTPQGLTAERNPHEKRTAPPATKPAEPQLN